MESDQLRWLGIHQMQDSVSLLCERPKSASCISLSTTLNQTQQVSEWQSAATVILQFANNFPFPNSANSFVNPVSQMLFFWKKPVATFSSLRGNVDRNLSYNWAHNFLNLEVAFCTFRQHGSIIQEDHHPATTFSALWHTKTQIWNKGSLSHWELSDLKCL